VTAETRSAKNNDVWELKRADKLDLIMNQSGGVERVAAFGQARLEKNAGSESRKLSGGELIAWVDAKGDVDRVEASDGASLDARDGDRITHLTAPKIRINPNGTIVTEGASIAVSADSRITGRDFNIEQGEELSTFTTSLPAKVETQRPGAPTRQMWAERSTTAKIDGKTNRLISLVSVGSVKFIDGDRHGWRRHGFPRRVCQCHRSENRGLRKSN
jgi:hypothetical protein